MSKCVRINNEGYNYIAETNFQRALTLSQQADYELQNNQPTNKKLNGIPISIKDVFICEGLDCTMGAATNINHPAKVDGMIVQLLLKAGLIPFIKTTVP